MAPSLYKSETMSRLIISAPKALSCGEKIAKSAQYIRRYSTKYASFFAVSYQKFTNELCQLWSYWTKVYAVNAHIEVAISHSVLECRSDEWGEFACFSTKLVAMAISVDISDKEVQISSAAEMLSFSEKFAKIGPVILVLRAIIKYIKLEVANLAYSLLSASVSPSIAGIW